MLLAPDLKEELPILYLRLRDSAERRRTRILELSARESGMTPYAWKSLRHRPGEQGALVRALVAGGRLPDGINDADVAAVGEQLAKGNVVVVAGRPSVAESSAFAEDALAVLHAALPGASFLSGLRRGNVHGALELGLTPGLLPGGVPLDQASDALRAAWPSTPIATGLDTAGILRAAADRQIGCLVLLGADPLGDFPDRELAQRGLEGVGTIVAVDTFLSASSQLADVVLAAAAFAEKPGTTTNLEGRVSALSQQVTVTGAAHADWIIAEDIALQLGHDLGFGSLPEMWDEIRAVSPRHAGIAPSALAGEHDGVVTTAPPASTPVEPSGATAPPLKGYGFRMAVGRKLYDAGVALTQSPSLAGLAAGGQPPPQPMGCRPSR